jgi:hypothetical protein
MEYLTKAYETLKAKYPDMSFNSIASQIAKNISKPESEGGLADWESYFNDMAPGDSETLTNRISEILRTTPKFREC